MLINCTNLTSSPPSPGRWLWDKFYVAVRESSRVSTAGMSFWGVWFLKPPNYCSQGLTYQLLCCGAPQCASATADPGGGSCSYSHVMNEKNQICSLSPSAFVERSRSCIWVGLQHCYKGYFQLEWASCISAPGPELPQSHCLIINQRDSIFPKKSPGSWGHNHLNSLLCSHCHWSA